MSDVVIAALIGSCSALAGSLITYLIQRRVKYVTRLERRAERYRAEIHARQAEENIAAKWLFELSAANTPNSAKIALRDRTEKETGLRPDIGPAEVRSS